MGYVGKMNNILNRAKEIDNVSKNIKTTKCRLFCLKVLSDVWC